MDDKQDRPNKGGSGGSGSFTEEQELRIKKRIYDDLEETYHGIDRRKEGSNIFISSLLIWLPITVALFTILVFIGYAWVNDQKVALLQGKVLLLEGVVNSRAGVEGQIRQEMQIWQAYTITLQKRLIEAGVEDIPDSPKPVNFRER